MTIREVINILIDAPDKDRPFEVEISRNMIPDDGYDWHTLSINRLQNCSYASLATAGSETHRLANKENEK